MAGLQRGRGINLSFCQRFGNFIFQLTELTAKLCSLTTVLCFRLYGLHPLHAIHETTELFQNQALRGQNLTYTDLYFII